MAAIGDDHADEIPDDESPAPVEGIEQDQRRTYLHQQIDSLPESYKILVTLRYQKEMSYEEIATVLSLPLGTVKTGLFRAKAQLRDALHQFEDSHS